MCVLLQSLYTGEDKGIAIATDSKYRKKNRFANICVCKSLSVSVKHILVLCFLTPI